MSQLKQQQNNRVKKMGSLKGTKAKESMKFSNPGWMPSDFADFVCTSFLCEEGKCFISPK